MADQLRLIVHKKNSFYDDVLVSQKCVCTCSKDCLSKQLEYNINLNNKLEQQKIKVYPVILREKGFNAYLISAYIYFMNHFDVYRKSAVNVLRHFIKMKIPNLNLVYPVIFIKLRTPKHQFLDYNWNVILTQMVLERREIDHAMAWLSTLGGAFSALGDKFDRCAKVAGKISVEQFKLSMRLGDPQLVARCKLYAALSLLQQGYLKVSGQIVKEIYKFAINDKDVKLQKMCQGVWAKLKYCHSQRKKKERIKQLKRSLCR